MESPTAIRLQMLETAVRNISANLEEMANRQQAIRKWVEEAREIIDHLQKQLT